MQMNNQDRLRMLAEEHREKMAMLVAAEIVSSDLRGSIADIVRGDLLEVISRMWRVTPLGRSMLEKISSQEYGELLADLIQIGSGFGGVKLHDAKALMIPTPVDASAMLGVDEDLLHAFARQNVEKMRRRLAELVE